MLYPNGSRSDIVLTGQNLLKPEVIYMCVLVFDLAEI